MDNVHGGRYQEMKKTYNKNKGMGDPIELGDDKWLSQSGTQDTNTKMSGNEIKSS